jgi:lipoyl(octanoyl) transferase
LRDLEKFVIDALAEIGLNAGVKNNLTGIWVKNRKIGAIGVAVSKWITYHGLALNLNIDLDYFKLINPCGIIEFPVGSISQLLKTEIKFEELANLLADNFARSFNYIPENIANIDNIM